MKEAVIVSGVRTPIGKYGGMLTPFELTQIGRASCRERV